MRYRIRLKPLQDRHVPFPWLDTGLSHFEQYEWKWVEPAPDEPGEWRVEYGMRVPNDDPLGGPVRADPLLPYKLQGMMIVRLFRLNNAGSTKYEC